MSNLVFVNVTRLKALFVQSAEEQLFALWINQLGTIRFIYPIIYHPF